MYVHFRRMHRAGMTVAQNEIAPLFEETTRFRAYCSNVIPGFFQTLDYATSILHMFAAFQGTPDDAERAAAARVSRSQSIYRPRNVVAVLIEEHILLHRIAADTVMADQLDYLSTVMSLPNVSIGILPLKAKREIWGLESFYIFDDRRVNVETLTAAVNIVAKAEIADYRRAFAILARSGVYGDDARALIEAARTALASSACNLAQHAGSRDAALPTLQVTAAMPKDVPRDSPGHPTDRPSTTPDRYRDTC